MDHPLDHIGIAVASIADALPRFEFLAGSSGSLIERIDSQGVDVVFIGGDGCRVELIEPVSAESPVARFIERRGGGLHHVAYRVPDLVAELARLESAGWSLIDRVPRPGAHGRLVAFVHPRSAGGVLVEFVQDLDVTGDS